MNVLAIDIGGSHLKFRTQKRSRAVKIDSSPKLKPADMVAAVLEHTSGWDYDRVSIGYPGPVVHNLPLLEPHSQHNHRLLHNPCTLRHGNNHRPRPDRVLWNVGSGPRRSRQQQAAPRKWPQQADDLPPKQIIVETV